MSNMSVATLRDPEFINVSPYNPLISQCEIKVLYLGENRNKSNISKEVAKEMANTLPGCPIVGYYREEKGDFGDHGDQMIIDSDGVKFKSLTQPYGFVAPDAKVWFQEFEDTDSFGITTIREYLMTTGYLWTGQYEEARRISEKGNNQSMELDKETLEGNWTKNANSGVDFFIINDAIFSKLCVLGEDVEPCFEGGSIGAPKLSANFSKMDDNFTRTLFTMMQDLKFALNIEGGQKMSIEKLEENQGKVDETNISENNVITDTFAKAKEDEKSKEDSTKENSEEDKDKEEDKFAKKEDEDKKDSKDEEKPKDDEEEEKFAACGKSKEDKEKYALLEQEHNELKTNFAALQESLESLKAINSELISFKAKVEKKEKEKLIDGFYMLSDIDKKDVVENIDKYSLDDIESKLSVICVRNKVSFDLDNSSKNESNTEDVATTFNLNQVETSNLPAWLKAVEETQKKYQ